MPNLETTSWIAGIASAVLSAVGIAWGVWTYVQQPTGDIGLDPKVIKQMEVDSARYKRFAEAWEATNYAQGNITRALNDKEMKVYAVAAQKQRDAMHFAEIGGRDDDALRLYREACELFEQLR